MSKDALSSGRRYGWVPDSPDQRDKVYSAAPEALKELPSKVDLRGECPEVYDQGSLGSCVAQSVAGIFQFAQRKQKTPDFIGSRLMLYFDARSYEGRVNVDSGCMIRSGIKAAVKIGVCPESQWPYEPSKFKVKPPVSCYTEAEKNQAIKYQRVNRDIGTIKACLASGFPFAFGFTVYDSFESDQVAKTGLVPMPSVRERARGGHAVVAVGYDDQQQCIIGRNSWGKRWGMDGYFLMPYLFLLTPNLSDDFWMIQSVEGEKLPEPSPTPAPDESGLSIPVGPLTVHVPAVAGDLLSLGLKK